MARPHPLPRARRLTALLALTALTACGTDSDDSAAGDAGLGAERGECIDDRDCRPTDTCFDGQCIFQGDPDAPAPADPSDPGQPDPGIPEAEQPLTTATRPVATRRHVWITRPATDTLARIDATTLRVDLTPLGDAPGPLAAVPDSDTVIVLATGSDALYRVTPDFDVDTWRLDHHHNALALSPDGRHALTWFDLDRAAPGEDAAALQTVTLLDLQTGDLTGLAVGYRPQRIDFIDRRALVTTRDGISTIDLDAPQSGPAPLIPVSRGLTGGPDRETHIDPTGTWAVSRDPAEPGITLTRLADAIPRYIPLGAEPTDLDLLPDGRALVMLRAARRLAIIDLATADDPATHRIIELPRAPLGAAVVAPDGRRALLYTTLDPPGAQSTIALLDPQSGALVYLPLRKPARGAAIDPTGRVALVRHPPDPDALDPLGQRPGYSLVDLDRGFVKLETTPGEPSDLVFHPPLALLALTHADAIATIDLDTFAVRTRALPSPPEVIGLLPALDRAFVTQTHPTGRISFLPLTGDAPLQTVTGFALNGRIE